DVLFVPAEPLPPDIAGVHCGGERNASFLPLMPKDRDRKPRIDAVARHHRELVARRHRLTGGVARGGEGGGRLERGSRVAVVRVRPYTRRALPRSEEHTSELQSRGHLVCRLLLEKKKTETTRVRHQTITRQTP